MTRARPPRWIFGVLLVLLFARPAFAVGAVQGKVLLPDPPNSRAYQQRRRSISPRVAPEPPDPPTAVLYLVPFAESGTDSTVPATRTNAEPPPRPVHASVAQQGLQFRPALSIVEVGTVVEFPNLDDTYHSVFSYSASRRFDLGRYRKGDQPATIVFDQPGVVKLFCEIHEHMRGVVLVVATKLYTKTDGDGHYRLVDVPAGRYRMVIWADETHNAEREITVADAETTSVDVDVRSPR